MTTTLPTHGDPACDPERSRATTSCGWSGRILGEDENVEVPDGTVWGLAPQGARYFDRRSPKRHIDVRTDPRSEWSWAGTLEVGEDDVLASPWTDAAPAVKDVSPPRPA